MIVRRSRQRVCACGCGAPVSLRTDGRPKKYVLGHNSYGMNRTKLYVSPGQVFGFLTVINQTGGKANLATCLCTCGAVREVRVPRLLSEHTRSCGSCQQAASQTTHGLSKKGQWHPLYSVWSNMKTRCTNPRVNAYKDYGGRGITVCDEWQQFENFYRDMVTGYAEGLTLERKNNDKGYSAGNCRWATRKEQAANRRTPRRRNNGPSDPQ